MKTMKRLARPGTALFSSALLLAAAAPPAAAVSVAAPLAASTDCQGQLQGVTMAVSPASQSAMPSDTVTAAIQVQAGAQPVDVVQIALSFPASVLEVIDADAAAAGIQITPGEGLPTVLQNSADNSSGSIQFAAGAALSQDVQRLTGTFTAATVQFRAKAPGAAALELGGNTSAVCFGSRLPLTVQNGVVSIGGAPSTGGSGGGGGGGGGSLTPPPPAVRPDVPTILGPAGGYLAQNFAPALRWLVPGGTTQFHLRVVPANNDGPGINLIISDQAEVAKGEYQVAAPDMAAGSNFVLLPGMSYRWEVRVSNATRALDENASEWGPWSRGDFRTPGPSSATISAASPGPGSRVGSLTPALTWNNSDNRIFYYEVQLSRNASFDVDPATATAPVYWELVHGGVSQPANTYKVRESFPLEPGATYFWRVRPRVQGDGAPVEWSQTWSFQTP